MAPATTHDLDYLTARLHARRSRMAEARRLDELCQQRTLSGLLPSLGAGADVSSVAAFQRQCLRELIAEIAFCRRHLVGREGDFVDWMRIRFQVENLKALLRGFLNRLTPEAVAPHLVRLDAEEIPDIPFLLEAANLDEFARRWPGAWLRRQLQMALASTPAGSPGFVLESRLDADYLRAGLERVWLLAEAESNLLVPLLTQRIEAFHLMLVVRGKFLHGMPAESLWTLQAADSGPVLRRLRLLLNATDFAALKEVALGHSLDEWPLVSGAEIRETSDFSGLELLTRNRLWRLANRAFRRSHQGFAAVAAFLELRQLEVANLITLSDGIRLGMAPSRIASHLCRSRRQNPEAMYV